MSPLERRGFPLCLSSKDRAGRALRIKHNKKRRPLKAIVDDKLTAERRERIGLGLVVQNQPQNIFLGINPFIRQSCGYDARVGRAVIGLIGVAERKDGASPV